MYNENDGQHPSLNTFYQMVTMFDISVDQYELLFLRMTFKEEKGKETKIRHRIAVLCTCRISVRRVLLFQREYMGRMYVRMKDEEFKNLIQEFRQACKRPTSQI